MIFFFLKLVSLYIMSSYPGHLFEFIESVYDNIINNLQRFQPGREKDLYEKACKYAFEQIRSEVSIHSLNEEELRGEFRNKIKEYVKRQQS